MPFIAKVDTRNPRHRTVTTQDTDFLYWWRRVNSVEHYLFLYEFTELFTVRLLSCPHELEEYDIGDCEARLTPLGRTMLDNPDACRYPTIVPGRDYVVRDPPADERLVLLPDTSALKNHRHTGIMVRNTWFKVPTCVQCFFTKPTIQWY